MLQKIISAQMSNSWYSIRGHPRAVNAKKAEAVMIDIVEIFVSISLMCHTGHPRAVNVNKAEAVMN